MANKDKLGDFYTSNNELGANVSMVFGNSSVNVSINSSSIVLSPNSSLSANGTIGSAGQVLTSNGTTVYWGAGGGGAGVNTDAQYTWANIQTFAANVIVGNSTVNATMFTNSSGVFFTGNVVGIGNTTYFVSNGNVGVGNSVPAIKLEVAGNMAVDAFVECSANIATNYTITTGRNAMSAGPIAINSGVTVTVPSGSTWTIV